MDRTLVVITLLLILTYSFVAWSLCDPWFPWRHRPVTACITK